MKGIMILGSSGSGKTVLGRSVSEKLDITFLDIDDYLWRTDTPRPYTVMYSKDEKINRIMSTLQKTDEFVMAGSMNSFHEHFDPFFALAVFLTADEKVRVNRVHHRETQEFGTRILPGGDMYEDHQKFLIEVRGYDHGASSNNREQHEEWIKQLTCPVLRLDGEELLEVNTQIITNQWIKIIGEGEWRI